MKARDLMAEAASRLEAARIPEPAREAETMVLAIAGIGRTALWRDDPTVTPDEAARIREAAARRALREPLQYILGQVEFMGMRLRVTPDVLVPRPETELLVEAVLARLPGDLPLHVLDLCTGSGAIALALAKARPGWRVTATDISAPALALAAENARAVGAGDVRFMQGDLFASVREERFGLIASNPPYVPSADIDALEPEVSQHEPRLALDGGPEGLDFYARIIAGAGEMLAAGGGMVALELGIGQAEAVSAMAREQGIGEIEVLDDYAGIPRVLIGRKSA